MADFTALKNAIQNAIKQNGNEEITGTILQEVMLAVVTTLGDGSINDLITALGNEATTRGNADTALSNRLGSTITAQNTAAAQIGAEAEARAAADTALQGLIDGLTDNIENGYVYAGIATPSSTPVTGKVFYLALTAGTYTNFGNIAVTQGINILKYNGSAWSLDAFIGIDDTPTPNSPKLVKSGGTFDSIMTDGSAFDISAHFASGGTLATYADLSAALTALNTLSTSYKRGGMSIKFVQSSDNKYVQYFLTKNEWSASEADWEKINLEEEVSQLDQKVDIDVDGIIYKDATIDTIGASSRIGVCMPIVNKDKSYHLEVINKEGMELSVYILNAKNYSTSHYLQKIYKNSSSYISLDFSIDDAIKSQAAYIGIFYYTNPNNVPIYIKWFGYKDSLGESINTLGESINTLDNNVIDLKIEVDGGLKCVLEIEKSIGSNPSITSAYGIWTDIPFKDYEEERGEPVVGTKYVSRVFDVRAFAGKTLKIRIAPRANMYGYAFVTDYTKITSNDATEWNNIYVSGISSSAKIDQDQEVVVPVSANYLVVTCTDLDLPYARLSGSLDERVSALEEDVTGNGIVELNNEVLTKSKILNAKRMGRSGNDTSGITPLMLLHFSDIHGNEANLSRIVEFYEHYKSVNGSPAINDAICTGDMVSGTLADGMTFWNNVDGAEDIMMCIGNHDAWANAQHEAVTKTDEYNAIIKPYVANWGVTQPTDAEANGLCYFYKDYNSSHIRLIVLDVYTHDDADYISNQNTWLQSVLESARTAATPLSVLIAVHQTAGNQNGFNCAFNAYQKGYSTSDIWSQFKASVAAFITAGGDFIGWIGGHSHIDVCGVDSTYPNQVKIAIDAANNTQGASYSDTYRSSSQNDKSYDCFNLIAIDVYQKTIKLIRIGADIDSWMRKKDMVTIQYASSAAHTITNPVVIRPDE